MQAHFAATPTRHTTRPKSESGSVIALTSRYEASYDGGSGKRKKHITGSTWQLTIAVLCPVQSENSQYAKEAMDSDDGCE